MKYRVINLEDLKVIIQKHKEWLKDNKKGERANLSFADLSSADLRSANLSFADLSSADLRFADLSSADLRSADLRSANLSFADLSSADLRFADLSSADLRSADLRFANLSFADLRSADLRFADLRFADLSSADLRSADLSSADLSSADLSSADLLVFQFQRHIAYFTSDGNLRIGCINKSIKEWIDNYEEIGKIEGYSELEIKLYGQFINMCAFKFNSKKDEK